MTPEEKAKELVEKFYPFTIYADATLTGKKNAWHKAQQCALIAVDEIILDNDDNETSDKIVYTTGRYLTAAQYWNEVKKAIITT